MGVSYTFHFHKKNTKSSVISLRKDVLILSGKENKEATLQSLTGKYREIQGNPCNENRDPAMKTGVPCNEYRFFPVGIDLQGFPVSYTGFGFAVRFF